ncbi:MAG: histidinol dehydrogenase [Bacteroidetes bacterium]|nr:histidinol dehydrogenase [Bacteroidota bacterium]
MNIFEFPEKSQWESLTARPVLDDRKLLNDVDKLVKGVKNKGDRWVKKLSKQFDGYAPRQLRVSEQVIRSAAKKVSPDLKAAIDLAYNTIHHFHSEQVDSKKVIETVPGLCCWRRSTPIDRVGLYIPGGTAPLFSTVLMLGIPAVIAGCSEVVICTPTGKDGSIHPAVLYCALKVGIKEVYACGGAQAIAAMAYGTDSIKKADKIFGPGNQYVTAAKRLVQLDGVAIDMPAGPSEVCVVADNSASPQFVAADLLSQAEHGPDSQVLLITDSRLLLTQTLTEIDRQLAHLPRKDIALQAIQNSRAILVENMTVAIELSNSYAPEHLIIASEDAVSLEPLVNNAGSVFLGNYAPESAGDYASGTNHTLPTNGNARAMAGVSVDSFVKKMTVQSITRQGLEQIGAAVMSMARAEGLEGHAQAIEVRLKNQ